MNKHNSKQFFFSSSSNISNIIGMMKTCLTNKLRYDDKHSFIHSFISFIHSLIRTTEFNTLKYKYEIIEVKKKTLIFLM